MRYWLLMLLAFSLSASSSISLIIYLFLPSFVLGLKVHSLSSFSFNSLSNFCLLELGTPWDNANGYVTVYPSLVIFSCYYIILRWGFVISSSLALTANLWFKPNTSASLSFCSSSFFFWSSFNSRCLPRPLTTTTCSFAVEGYVLRI